jgi:4-diphosphocytidyl-2-C-methyl-D-erythritol kinase
MGALNGLQSLSPFQTLFAEKNGINASKMLVLCLMIAFPNAKINLGLHILGKRPDGYHNIESVFYPIGLTDKLELKHSQSSGLQLKLSGIPVPGSVDENLCVKAYNLISKDYPLPGLELHLTKNIPVGAGLGGGSSDGAAFIRLLNDFLELGLAWGEMHHYAKQLGSDCSFFISNRPSIVTGRGEIMESILLSLQGFYLVLVCPALHIGTAEAYASIMPGPAATDLELLVTSEMPKAWKGRLVNDFEKSIFQKYPLLAALKETLYEQGAVYASMTGSGSAIYGLFEKEPKLAGAFKDAFVWKGSLEI